MARDLEFWLISVTIRTNLKFTTEFLSRQESGLDVDIRQRPSSTVREYKVFAKLFNEVTNHDSVGTDLNLFKCAYILTANLFYSMQSKYINL